ALQTYDTMYNAYLRIFERLGLTFRAVAADTGSIGGSRSHEFQVIADTGEDLIVFNPETDYAANIELAEAPCLLAERAPATAALTEVATPGKTRCEDVAALLGVPLSQLVKTLVVSVEPEEDGGTATLVALLLRGDHELNEIKTGKLPGFGKGFRFATDEEIEAAFGCVPGFIGPVQPKQPVKVIADRSVAN